MSDFAGHDELPEAVYAVAMSYDTLKEYEKSLAIHEYNFVNHPASICSMWGRVEVIAYHIRNGEDTLAESTFNSFFFRLF